MNLYEIYARGLMHRLNDESHTGLYYQKVLGDSIVLVAYPSYQYNSATVPRWNHKQQPVDLALDENVVITRWWNKKIPLGHCTPLAGDALALCGFNVVAAVELPLSKDCFVVTRKGRFTGLVMRNWMVQHVGYTRHVIVLENVHGENMVQRVRSKVPVDKWVKATMFANFLRTPRDITASLRLTQRDCARGAPKLDKKLWQRHTVGEVRSSVAMFPGAAALEKARGVMDCEYPPTT